MNAGLPFFPWPDPLARQACAECACQAPPVTSTGNAPCPGGTPWIDLGQVGTTPNGLPLYMGILGYCPDLYTDIVQEPE